MCRGSPLIGTRLFWIPCYFELKTISLGSIDLYFSLQFYLTYNESETLGTTISSVTTKFHRRVVSRLSKDPRLCACACTMTRIAHCLDGKLLRLTREKFLITSSFCWFVENDNLRQEVARIGYSSWRSGNSVKAYSYQVSILLISQLYSLRLLRIT